MLAFRFIQRMGPALLMLAVTHWSKAGDTKLFIFWDTVSPDGKYALGWSTTGSIDVDSLVEEMNGVDTSSEIKNGLVDVASRKMILVLPEAEYWELPQGGRPNHYSMFTVWSDDSQSLLAIYDSRYETDQAYFVDTKTLRAKDLITELRSAFYQVVRDKAASYYRKYGKEYSIDFLNPWFIGHDTPDSGT